MDEVIQKLQREAERIAARHGHPEFYLRFQAPMAQARKLFFSHPLLVDLRQEVEPVLQEGLGHGYYHCMRVSLDSAALIHAELELNPMEPVRLERLMLLGMVAGLLHDICRSEADHATAGARRAGGLLKYFPLTEEEVVCVCQAIRNHEAFKSPVPCGRPWSQLISDCLYDADKFRWGPDNFTHTLWHMVDHHGITPYELIGKFPRGMTAILRIRDTFRTNTGRQYGPDIIETGISIGKEMFRYLVQNYGEH